MAASLVVAVGLVSANMLGVASAEAPTTTTATPMRTVGVDGVATVPVAQGANRAVATGVYREGMAAAISDGQSKAEFLAGKAGATLGAVQSIIEGGGSIDCTTGGESGYVEYEGEQPDFGSPSTSVYPELAPRVEGSASRPTVHKPAAKHRKKKPRKKPSAKAATTTACTLSTDVTLVYAID
ncbi:MAG: hypothetical protein ACRDJX_01945 [Solirubrobacteraceae bacterium]